MKIDLHTDFWKGVICGREVDIYELTSLSVEDLIGWAPCNFPEDVAAWDSHKDAAELILRMYKEEEALKHFESLGYMRYSPDKNYSVSYDETGNDCEDEEYDSLFKLAEGWVGGHSHALEAFGRGWNRKRVEMRQSSAKSRPKAKSAPQTITISRDGDTWNLYKDGRLEHANMPDLSGVCAWAIEALIP